MKSVAFAGQPANWEREALVVGYYNQIGVLRTAQFMSQTIGPFYERYIHRLLTYLLLVTCLIGGAFLALGVAGKSAFVLQHLPLACTLALFQAMVFTFSHVFSDLAAHYLGPSRMAYGSRSVGRQLIVVFSGLALGFWVHQGVFPELMQLCAPRPATQMFAMLSAVPLCCTTIYACVMVVPMSHHGTKRKEAAGYSQPGLALPPAQPMPVAAAVSPPPPAGRAKLNTVSFRCDGRQINIPLEAVTHVSMEDHYCRVFYQSGQGSQEFLVREALAGLIRRVDSEDFLQIHRSHLVNKKHIRAYKRTGRNHWLLLGPGRVPLPISRRRQSKVKEALALSG